VEELTSKYKAERKGEKGRGRKLPGKLPENPLPPRFRNFFPQKKNETRRRDSEGSEEKGKSNERGGCIQSHQKGGN